MSMCAVGRERDVREGICDLMWQIWKHEMVVMYVCTNTELAILLCVLRANGCPVIHIVHRVYFVQITKMSTF